MYLMFWFIFHQPIPWHEPTFLPRPRIEQETRDGTHNPRR